MVMIHEKEPTQTSHSFRNPTKHQTLLHALKSIFCGITLKIRNQNLKKFCTNIFDLHVILHSICNLFINCEIFNRFWI